MKVGPRRWRISMQSLWRRVWSSYSEASLSTVWSHFLLALLSTKGQTTPFASTWFGNYLICIEAVSFSVYAFSALNAIIALTLLVGQQKGIQPVKNWVVGNSFDICMFILSRTARWCQYLINSAFLLFFWSCQKSALIAILKTPSGSICFNSWLWCYCIV